MNNPEAWADLVELVTEFVSLLFIFRFVHTVLIYAVRGFYTAVLGFGGHSTLPHHLHFPLWKFIEYVNIASMDPWDAAVQSFGSDREFLRFNCLSIAFQSKGMIYCNPIFTIFNPDRH